MKFFWKFIVLTGLFFQFNFAYSANEYRISSIQKENSTALSKESLSSSHFIHPSIDRGTLDQNHNSRIPVGINNCSLLLQSFSGFQEKNLKIPLSEQDIDRCIQVSILLFPFHYFW